MSTQWYCKYFAFTYCSRRDEKFTQTAHNYCSGILTFHQVILFTTQWSKTFNSTLVLFLNNHDWEVWKGIYISPTICTSFEILLELRWQLMCPHVVFKSAFVLARAPLWGTWDRFFSWNRCGFLCQFGEAMRFMLDKAVRVGYFAVRKL